METSKAKIGVLGTGVVGQTLGAGFASLGHDVKMGSREPGSDKVKGWVDKTGERASSGTFAEAAAFGEVILIATLGSGTESAVRLAGIENFDGKVVIDTTNPLVFEENKLPALSVGHTDSGGEQLQRLLPKARVVKAYNTVGAPHMVSPSFPGGPPDMFICGDDADAKRVVTEINAAFGWNTIDVGGIDGARLLEPMCILWVVHGIRSGTWNHAFKLLKK